jgi:hypothetical protein
LAKKFLKKEKIDKFTLEKQTFPICLKKDKICWENIPWHQHISENFPIKKNCQ